MPLELRQILRIFQSDLNLVYCFVVRSSSTCFGVIELFLLELQPLILEKLKNFTVFRNFFFWGGGIFTAVALKLGLCFEVKSYSTSSSCFSVIDLLFFTKMGRHIIPQYLHLHCSCFLLHNTVTSNAYLSPHRYQLLHHSIKARGDR
jgi:hypothetical protein